MQEANRKTCGKIARSLSHARPTSETDGASGTHTEADAHAVRIITSISHTQPQTHTERVTEQCVAVERHATFRRFILLYTSTDCFQFSSIQYMKQCARHKVLYNFVFLSHLRRKRRLATSTNYLLCSIRKFSLYYFFCLVFNFILSRFSVSIFLLLFRLKLKSYSEKSITND